MTTEELGGAPEQHRGVTVPQAGSAFDLRPPPPRSGFVVRTDLVETLTSTSADVVTLTAPTGYGKTTVLGQWARMEVPPVAWLTLSRDDNNPKILLGRLAASLRRVGVVTADDVARLQFMAESDALTRGVEQFSLLVEGGRAPIVMILDDAHFLKSRAVAQVLTELVQRLEEAARWVLASHSSPKIRLPSIRASGRLLDLTEAQLAFSSEEIERLVSGLGLDRSLAPDIMRSTDGWPVAAFLVAIAARDGDVALDDIRLGSRPHLDEFVRSEVVPYLSKRRREFLTRMSPLESLSGSLCDAVSDSPGSQRLLESLESDTHLIHPIDHDRTWFAMNRVLRDTLLTEFDRDRPAEVRKVHFRAASWFADHGRPLDAIRHAQEAGDTAGFASLMEGLIKSRYATGHAGDVLLWMDWLQANVALDRFPGLAAIGALVHLQEGNISETETWLTAARTAPADSNDRAVTFLATAAQTRSGVEQMMRDIEMALETAGPGSQWLPAILATQGLAHVMNDDVAAAEPCFVESARLGLENGSLASVILALGQRALIAMRRHDWDLAGKLVSEALAIIDEHGFDGYQVSGLPLVAAARWARRSNDIAETRRLLARAATVRPRLSAAIPGESVQILIEMARVHVELADVVGARALIREAEDIVLQRNDLGVLPGELHSLKESLASLGPGTVGLPALTKAELRLLPLLATHMSFPEIGEELFISRHTVKSQATSIYRKLGCSTRSEAMTKAFEIGLLSR